MEDGLKISELTTTTTINDSDLIPIVQNDETKNITKEDLVADTKALIDRNSTYSTTEQVIGTWIDEKPIYRKVINVTGTMSIGAWTTIGNLTNVDTLVYGKIYDSPSKAIWNEVMIRINSNNVQYYQSLSLAHSFDGIILEYTKTTD